MGFENEKEFREWVAKGNKVRSSSFKAGTVFHYRDGKPYDQNNYLWFTDLLELSPLNTWIKVK